MNPKLYYVRTKERLNVLPSGRFFFLKKKSWKGISEHVSFFSVSYALWQERNSFPNHESTNKLRLASGLKRGGDKDEKAKMNIIRLLRNYVSLSKR